MSKKEYTLEQVEDMVVNEMGRRMEQEAEEFPAHVMANLLKIRERREQAAEVVEAKPFRLLDELPTLPTPRAMQLAKERIKELQDEMAELEGFIAREKQETAEVPVREVR